MVSKVDEIEARLAAVETRLAKVIEDGSACKIVYDSMCTEAAKDTSLRGIAEFVDTRFKVRQEWHRKREETRLVLKDRAAIRHELRRARLDAENEKNPLF